MIKDAVIWLNDFETVAGAGAKIGKWIEFDYNKLYMHGTLGYISPAEYEEVHNQSQLVKVARKTLKSLSDFCFDFGAQFKPNYRLGLIGRRVKGCKFESCIL